MRYHTLLIGVLLLGCSCHTNFKKTEEASSPETGTPLIWGFSDHGFWGYSDNIWGVDENGFWGYDSSGAKYDLTSPVFKKIIEEFGFNLVVQEYARRPALTSKENILALQRMHDFFSELNTKWIINTEAANHRASYTDSNGYDWYNRSDGRHYYQFPDSVLQALSEMKNKPGLLYDELAHMQNSRNITARPPAQSIGTAIDKGGVDAPCFFNEEDTVSLEQAAAGFTAKAEKVVRYHKDFGLQLYSEHVFPIQFHTLAKAGFIPVTKVLKENCSPAYIACALGAAIQYNKPFWITPDLYMDVHPESLYPGHYTDEYRSSLLLAYHMGAEGIYTEKISGGGLIQMNDKKTDYEVTPHGRVAKWFRFDYVPEHPRNYNFRELVPRVAIIRQEDTTWGQSDSWLPDWLFGIKTWHSTPETEAWLQIWNLLSNGKISPYSLSWHNNKVRNTPYYLFYPLDGVVVFDENVGMEHLKDAGLIFLSGLRISEPTLKAVELCVRQGAVCMALPHLAPDYVLQGTGNNGIFQDGEGKWVVSGSFMNEIVKQNTEPFLPHEEYIRYRFGDTEVQFRPVDGDYNKITVDIITL